ncbi:LiaG family protein [Bacillus sp. NPDC077027]|uniref:LiaG family protein n=1 Tax=Bacillus sp. NPDC077027 TaxID=3390548 RepID=UPI003D087C0E
MKRLLGLLFMVVGIFLIIGMFFKDRGFADFGFTRGEAVTTASAKTADIQRLDVSLSGFHVTVEPEKRKDIAVSVENGKGKMYAEQTGSTFRVRAENKRFLFFSGVEKGELLIKVPVDYHQNVTITGDSGKIYVDGRGELTLNDVVLKSTSGKLIAENLSAKNAEIKATSGKLEVSHIDAEDSEISVTSGNVDIADVKGSLKMGMTSGRLRASFDTITAPISFHMTSGSAKIDLPDQGDFKVKTKVTSGKIDHSYNFDQVDGGNRNFTGIIGKGTHLFDIEMTSGKLRLR